MEWTDTLNTIFIKRAGIDFEKKRELKDELLFGKKIQMPARELVYAYLDIERELSLPIPESFIIEGRFDTYSHIMECVGELSQQK